MRGSEPATDAACAQLGVVVCHSLTPTASRIVVGSLAANVAAVDAVGVGGLRRDDKVHLVGCRDSVGALGTATATSCALNRCNNAEQTV